jgi:hypothetical protein
MPPIATEFTRHDESSRSAMSRPEQVQQGVWTKLRLLDHLVGAAEQSDRESKAKRLGSFEIDRELGPRGLLDRQVGRFVALENPAGIYTGDAIRDEMELRNFCFVMRDAIKFLHQQAGSTP